MTSIQKLEEADAPIEIYSGDSVIDGGIAAIPKMVLRFSRHLTCDGFRRNDRQVLLIIMVIALREDRTLRLSYLPMIAAHSTLESDLTHLRKMGLVFTRRDYFDNVTFAIYGQPRSVIAIYGASPAWLNLGLLPSLAKTWPNMAHMQGSRRRTDV